MLVHSPKAHVRSEGGTRNFARASHGSHGTSCLSRHRLILRVCISRKLEHGADLVLNPGTPDWDAAITRAVPDADPPWLYYVLLATCQVQKLYI